MDRPVVSKLLVGCWLLALLSSCEAPAPHQPGSPQLGPPQPGSPQPGSPQPGSPQPGSPQPGPPPSRSSSRAQAPATRGSPAPESLPSAGRSMAAALPGAALPKKPAGSEDAPRAALEQDSAPRTNTLASDAIDVRALKPRSSLADLAIQGPVSSVRGVVTSVERQATEAGVRMLARGGNAVDAAVATAFALAVTHPSAGNLGGGGFALVRAGDVVRALDFREDSPRALTERAFYEMLEQDAKTGAAVGVPGTVAGLLQLHEELGKLSREEVLLPAEELAERGFLLSERTHMTLVWAKADLLADPVAARTFFRKGAPLPSGSRLKRKDLALALRRIRSDGRAGFYEGPTARDLVASLGPTGVMTLADLASYEGRWRRPLTTSYRGYHILTMPPPSAGGVAIVQLLGMLGQAELPLDQAEALHIFAEASRRAQVERRLFVAAPERTTAEERARLEARWLDPLTWLGPHPIDNQHATPSLAVYPKPDELEREQEHTTHLAAVDQEGNVVSMTLTLSGSFGTRIFTRETGIALNNSVASFSALGKNTPAPGVRTVSSMAPTLVVTEHDTLALGSPGGDTIPSTVALTVMAIIDRRLGLREAVLGPRIHQGLFPDLLETETSHPLSLGVRRTLIGKGHTLKAKRFAQGDANLAAFLRRQPEGPPAPGTASPDDPSPAPRAPEPPPLGMAHAVCDPREGGLALGAPLPQPSEASEPR